MTRDPDSGFGFYLDANLTIQAGPLLVQQKSDGSTDPVDFLLYFGSPNASVTARAASNPGVDNILISVADAASGTGHPATEVKLATTSGGLAGATGGASLSLGPTVVGGVAGAEQVHVRVDDTTGVVGFSNELSLVTNSLVAGAP